ncbi:MAG: plasmid pRiA4b ORF-3 family protein [Isosphaeraceae bacterium]
MRDYLDGKDTGPIVFRLKRTKKASHLYPLKLTQLQRDTLLRCTSLNRSLEKKIKQAGEGTQIVGVTWNELHTLNDQTGEAAVYAPSAEMRRLMAVQARVIKFFEEEHAEVFDTMQRKTPKRRLKKSKFLYQFRITLLDIKPAIWRRIQVRDCTLPAFHETIQAAFGWLDYHLHQFEIDGVQYSQPAPDGDDFGLEFEDETRVLLSHMLPQSAKRTHWIYEYDFGDGWRHDVLFEGCPPLDPSAEYPVCLEGERACPPEDCGGTSGYADFLAAITNPHHEQHEEMLAWGGAFDPEAFDAEEATSEMRKLRR